MKKVKTHTSQEFKHWSFIQDQKEQKTSIYKPEISQQKITKKEKDGKWYKDKTKMKESNEEKNQQRSQSGKNTG